ncbi:MAG TPA: sigma-70 family RNA polymerase sigma factor [Caulobacteraceae bacterium]|nr:sigma-70 family RNA polymerase sigma factor [Caulobacteraceae bacterium]
MLLLDSWLSVPAPKARNRTLTGWLRPQTSRAQSSPAAPGPEDAGRFRDLMVPHLDAAYAFARFLCRDPVAAEDLVQDAYLAAFRAFGQFRGGEPKAWLFAILRNRFLETVRKARAGRELALAESDADEPADPDTPETILLRVVDDEILRAAIEALPEPFREAVVLRDLQDLAYRQIADITGVALGTVMSRLARGRKLLAQSLSEAHA